MKDTYKFGDIPVEVWSRGKYFGECCKDYLDSNEKGIFRILATDEDLKYEEKQGEQGQNFSKSYLEFVALYRKFCEKSVDYGVVLCHGSVVEVDGKAYMFTAPSGTGKSTHTRLWRELLKKKAVMINDDKPLLRFEDDGVYAYGTPWDGKHHLSNNTRGKLAGICFLNQGKENKIKKLEEKAVVDKLLKQIYRPLDSEALFKTLEYVDKLIKSVPMYEMSCNMSIEAAEMSYKTMKENGNEN